jgi:hypothetical protein
MHLVYNGILFLGGILLVVLISSKTQSFSSLAETETTEGFRMPKFPSVDDIKRPILKPVNKIGEQAQKNLKQLSQMEKGLTRQLKGITKQITQQINTIESKIMGGFNSIFDWIKQGISFILFFPQCFLWYGLHTLGYICYAPIAFIVWIFGLQSVEKMLFEYIEMADKLAYRATGVHLFHFSDEIQARCYFSKSKLRELRKKASDAAAGDTFRLDDPSIDDSEMIGYIVFGIFFLVLCCLVIYGI